MRDVNNGWLIRYLHGAPWDGYLGKKWVTEQHPFLLLILLELLITLGLGMQSVDLLRHGLPRRKIIGGRVYDEDYKLDTSRRAQYSLLALSRICRSRSSLYDQVRVIGQRFGRDDVTLIRDQRRCKHLSTHKAWISKPWELTAYASGLSVSTRGRNPRSSLLAKGGSSNKLYSSLTPKHKKGALEPDSPKSERSKVPVSSWLKERIDGLPRTNNKIGRLIEIISNPEYLFTAYSLIKHKGGNMTPGVGKKTLDGVDWAFFVDLSNKLKKGQFNFTASRKVLIPKANGGTRPLSVGPPRDKIVQKAIALALETIFEPQFSESSFGFRPKRSVHMALKELYLKGGNYTWAINGDISQCFPSIPHDVIMNLIRKQISCARTLELIHKSLKTKVLDTDGRITNATIGTPQGSVVSPILSNIVLNALDEYILEYKIKFEVGRNRAINRKYHSLNTVRHKTKNKELRARNLALMLRMNPKDTQDPNFKRLLYVRYADDFVVLLIGGMQEAYTLRRSLKDFLKHKLGLDLNMEKTSIVNTKDGFNFLGSHIQRAEQRITVATSSRNHSNHVVRKRVNRRLILNAPLKVLVEKLIKNKFARRNHLNQVIASGRKDLVNHSHFDIIRFYNWRIRGILNFYSFAANYSSLGRIVWLFTLSCSLTLALKHKLGTASKAFSRFGPKLADPETGVEIFSETSMKVKHDYKTDSQEPIADLDKLLSGSPHGTLTKKIIDAKCAICNSNSNIEMHHVRKASDIRSKIRTGNSTYHQWAGGFLRKQIPLCRYHHLLLHEGRLTHFDYRKMSKWTAPKATEPAPDDSE